MSSDPAPPTPTPPTAQTAPPSANAPVNADDRIVVYRHSNLFYWWPIWLLGFIFAGITAYDDMHLAVVPAGTKAIKKQKIDIDGKVEEHDILLLPHGKEHWQRTNADGVKEIVQPTIYVSNHKILGTIFVAVLLVLIVITNVSIRGLWTIVVLVGFVLLTFILAAAGLWSEIFEKLRQREIYINMGAYLQIAIVLFTLWVLNFALFDRQTYLIFTPGQVRVRTEVGGEETVYGTAGMVVQKTRNDLFRHWVFGFGSGDLIITPVGVHHPIEFPNVMLVGSVVAKIQEMVAKKVTVEGAAAN